MIFVQSFLLSYNLHWLHTYSTMYTRTYAHTEVHTHMYIHTHTRTHTHNTHICTYTHTDTQSIRYPAIFIQFYYNNGMLKYKALAVNTCRQS